MKQYVNDIRIQQWLKIIENANNSGVPRYQWFKENGITKDQYYYWLDKCRKYLAEKNGIQTEEHEEVELVEVPIVANPKEKEKKEFNTGAIINIGGISIDVNESSSPEFIENLGRMIHNAL